MIQRCLSKRFIFILSFVSIFFLISADLNNQTTASARYQDIKIRVMDELISTDLDSPGVKIKKFQNGRLKQLTIHLINAVIDLQFHPVLEGAEKVAMIRKYRIYDGLLLLDGPVRKIDKKGNLLAETNWSKGVLHGQQLIYDEHQKLVEQRYYDQGYPVGEWCLFYANGNKASEITFPSSLEDWEKTKSAGDDSPLANDIFTMAYRSPLAIKENWYNQDAIKRKEIEYKIYKTRDSFVVKPTGLVINFDSQGNAVKTRDLSSGSGYENHVFSSLGINYQERTTWFSDRVFKQHRFILGMDEKLVED